MIHNSRLTKQYALLLITGLMVLTSPLAMAANRGECMIASGKDLTGQTVVFSHSVDPRVASSKLPFVPASLFIAKGYALKIFERPYFGGAGLLIGRPLEVKYADPIYDLHPTDGGTYINVEQLKSNRPNVTRLVFPVDVASLACVPAGTPFDNSRSKAFDLYNTTYFNGSSFYLWANPGRADSYQAQLTSLDGKEQLTIKARLGYTPGRDVSLTVDLISGSIEIKREQATELYENSESDSDQHMRYLGALSIVRDTLRFIVNNDRAWRGAGEVSPVPNLELQAVLEVFDRAAFSL